MGCQNCQFEEVSIWEEPCYPCLNESNWKLKKVEEIFTTVEIDKNSE